MTRKAESTIFYSELIRLSRRAGGSHETLTSREKTLNQFVEFLRDNGIRLQKVENIKLKHVKQWIYNQKQQEISVRTLQNRLSHIRSVLTEGGSKFVTDHHFTNESLIGEKSSRQGTKRAISDEHFRKIIENADRISPGLGALLRLERRLGLRSMEALRSIPSLKTWMKNIKEGKPIEIIYGTKGGRKRVTDPPDLGQAYNAVRRALNVLGENGGKWFEKSTDLKSAERLMRKTAREAGLHGAESMHSLRYAFTRERYEKYLTEGLSEKESLAATSMDLGHGDGRGRWVKSVYLK